jgi:hypothetical protein
VRSGTLYSNTRPTTRTRFRLCLREHATNTTLLGIFRPTAGFTFSTLQSSSNWCALVCAHECSRASGLLVTPPKDDFEAAEDSNVVRANGQIKKLLRRVRYHF